MKPAPKSNADPPPACPLLQEGGKQLRRRFWGGGWSDRVCAAGEDPKGDRASRPLGQRTAGYLRRAHRYAQGVRQRALFFRPRS